MKSRNISCKVSDVAACGRVACWSTLESTKTTTGITAIRADRLKLTSWPAYPSWLWRLLPKHLKLRHCGLIASRLPAVNQPTWRQRSQAVTESCLCHLSSTQESAPQRLQTYFLCTEELRRNMRSGVNTKRRAEEAAQRKILFVYIYIKKSTHLWSC